MSDKKISIQVTPDGPLKVTGFDSLKFCGQTLESPEEVYLCRCGESTNAPFCDGKHAKAGFSGKCESSNSKETKVWEGSTLRTHFNPNICMHVFYCKPLKELREKELGGDVEAGKKIASVVQTCPSGALTYEWKGGEVSEMPSSGEIDIQEGGEIRIQGPSEGLELKEGQPQNRVTLCRCGQSKNKPFCDGRHIKKEGFR